MTLMTKRWYRSRRHQVLIFIILILLFVYMLVHNKLSGEPDLDITRRTFYKLVIYNPAADKSFLVASKRKETAAPIKDIDVSHVKDRASVIEYIENKLQEALKEDQGTGCDIPNINPFAKEVTQFDKKLPKIVCDGRDWVRCYLSECRVKKELLNSSKSVECIYKDILYESDQKYSIGPPTKVLGDKVYKLAKSDYVKIKCTRTIKGNVFPSKWTGHGAGFRRVKPEDSPPGRQNTVSVLILGFDSTSKNGFIRRMPKSYEVLKKELNATILNGYNIVGDGTPASLFPILTGKTELELPESRKSIPKSGYLDAMPFIFYKLQEDGYRTAYFEDMPWIGTFQYRFNGFLQQPSDHYMRPFFLDESGKGSKWGLPAPARYCIGDTPRYKVMLNVTEQFFKLDGKKFAFTFLGDITHDDFNMISTSDEDTVDLLRSFKADGHLKNTLLLVMGDHGPRYANVRETLQGKLEERLPLMAIVLPDKLKTERPNVVPALQSNVEVLTTPHDIHAMLLDAMGLNKYRNNYKVHGADLPRGMSLLAPSNVSWYFVNPVGLTKNRNNYKVHRPDLPREMSSLATVPPSRSCSEAGIEPHWCACLRWNNVSLTDPQYQNTAQALLDHLNSITESMRSNCVPRTLTSIEWVMRQRVNSRVLSFQGARDHDGYVGKFADNKIVKTAKENFQLKIIVGPGRGVYEASLTYHKEQNKYFISNTDISRTNAYGTEPSCISATHPHLNMYCYCKTT